MRATDTPLNELEEVLRAHFHQIAAGLSLGIWKRPLADYRVIRLPLEFLQAASFRHPEPGETDQSPPVLRYATEMAFKSI
jgi:hypothetical protein